MIVTDMPYRRAAHACVATPGESATVPPMFEARFQTFDNAARSATGPHVAALRAELARRGLSGFILQRADRHQNEYGHAGVARALGQKRTPCENARYSRYDRINRGQESEQQCK
jgi:hypothetical protein